ncbi:DUF4347 domain-containing protein, partial [Microcoleus sp. AR_TQ3_B6]|uniref:DUF4347 domain-containing protein n=1 Tax=Microcoleus sp. AR_TQ3_B6 TaxID=3055284 RepID=UPI002FD47F0A
MTPQKNALQLIFIDSNVEDYQSLISGISPNSEVIILDKTLDGIEQITERLAIEQNIEAIHIISHGSPGAVQLGANTLNSSNIESFAPQLQQWRKALIPGADILLYGCNVAACNQPWQIECAAIQRNSAYPDYGISTRAGGFSLCSSGFNRPVENSPTKPTKPNQFLERLSELTGADIAASANPTGNAALGGNWELEVKIGRIEAIPIQALGYSHILATANPDNKAIPVNSPPIAIGVLANDTGSTRLSVQSITTPTNGTATTNDWIYAGGNFTLVNGTSRNHIARLNRDGSLDTTFNPIIEPTGTSDAVWAIALDSSGKPVIGGTFTSINGTPINRIARLNTDGSLDTTFNPGSGIDNAVLAIALDSSGKLLVGGQFYRVNGIVHPCIARLNSDGSLDINFNAGSVSGAVQDLALDSSGKPVIGGSFTINAIPRNRIARLNTDGTVDINFDAGAIDGDVYGIALDSNDKPFIGGPFTTINGIPRNRIARLNTNGTVDNGFLPGSGMDGDVNAIALDSSGKPIVGGNFSTFNGTTRQSIARLNTGGTLDFTFNPGSGMDNRVEAIALDSNSKLIVGGAFSKVNNITRNRIARLNTDGTLDNTTFNPGVVMNNRVRAIALYPSSNILYTPNAGFNGVDTFQYTATDGTASTPTTVSVLVNDSPALDNTGTPTLNPQNQNDSASPGTLISTIIANLGGTKITDPNLNALQGIAITNLDTTNGTWQYTTNSTTWNNAPAVSATNALLLASDANTKIRFVPNPGYNGTLTNAIAFVAWDRITGTNGNVANVTAERTNNTTSSVFSSATETANIAINPLPTVTSVSAATPDGTYGIGRAIDITVKFSQIVNVTGTPQLSLAGVTPVASYFSGTGSDTLTFRYAVANGDISPDLDYVSTTALSLSGGTIKNAVNGDAILTLVTPGAANSLGASKAIVIDGIVPTVALTSTSPTTVNAPFSVTATFRENVSGFDNTDITLANANVSNFVTVDGKTYTFDVTPNADGPVTVDVRGATATDTAGNNNTAATQLVRNADVTRPTVALTSTSPTTINAPFLVTATFSENVTGFSSSGINVTNGTVSGFTGSGTTYTFTVTPNADGNVTVNVPEATATDTASNNNTAATQLIRTADVTAPAASLGGVSNITNAGGTSQTLTVTFSDSSGIDVSSLDDS